MTPARPRVLVTAASRHGSTGAVGTWAAEIAAALTGAALPAGEPTR